MKTTGFAFMFLMLCMTANAETYLFVGSNFPVLSEQTEDVDFRGIGIDIARIIGEKLGHTINIRLYPWVRAQHMVKHGAADVLIAPYKTPEREEWLDFTETYFFVDKSFFYVRPDSDITWDGDLTSLRGKKIGMGRSWSVGAAFEEVKDSLSIDYASDIDLCVKKLLGKRFDMLPAQPREANAAFERLGISEEQRPVIIYPALDINYNYFGFSKKKQKELSDFKKAFDRELKQMSKSGEIARLLKEKYGISDQN